MGRARRSPGAAGTSGDQVDSEPVTDQGAEMPNRALLVDRLAVALARLRREVNPVGVFAIDVPVDQAGAADPVLAALADRLRSTLRPGDTVGRLGGASLGVICPELRRELDAARPAERIVAALGAPVPMPGQEFLVSASVGIATTRSAASIPEALLGEAEDAMRRAKRQGGGYHMFDESIGSQAQRRLVTERALRRAVAAGELRVLYQPVISLREGRVVGVEALIRWEAPDRGQLGPEAFMTLAEETGLIVPIGNWVLEETCRQAARWCQANQPGSHPMLYVNLSPRQFVEPHLVDVVASVLAETGVDAGRLCLELTERALMEDTTATAATLEGLTGLGVRIVVDDFGTGWSSLGHLRRLPVSAVKVDRSFVNRLELDAQDASVVAAIIGLAHALGLQAIAEGVETGGQLARLDALGCDLAQGYLFAEPEPGGRIGELFGQNPAWQ